MKLAKLLLLLLFVVNCTLIANEKKLKDGYYLTGLNGTAYSFDSTLNIHRPNEAYKINASYDTKPFTDYPYYAFRLEKWTDNKAYGIELIHHKIYLNNPQRSLKNFSISDGYNLLTLNRTWHLDDHHFFRLGLGAVLAHPDVTFDNGPRFHRVGGFK